MKTLIGIFFLVAFPTLAKSSLGSSMEKFCTAFDTTCNSFNCLTKLHPIAQLKESYQSYRSLVDSAESFLKETLSLKDRLHEVRTKLNDARSARNRLRQELKKTLRLSIMEPIHWLRYLAVSSARLPSWYFQSYIQTHSLSESFHTTWRKYRSQDPYKSRRQQHLDSLRNFISTIKTLQREVDAILVEVKGEENLVGHYENNPSRVAPELNRFRYELQEFRQKTQKVRETIEKILKFDEIVNEFDAKYGLDREYTAALHKSYEKLRDVMVGGQLLGRNVVLERTIHTYLEDYGALRIRVLTELDNNAPSYSDGGGGYVPHARGNYKLTFVFPSDINSTELMISMVTQLSGRDLAERAFGRTYDYLKTASISPIRRKGRMIEADGFIHAVSDYRKEGFEYDLHARSGMEPYFRLMKDWELRVSDGNSESRTWIVQFVTP